MKDIDHLDCVSLWAAFINRKIADALHPFTIDDFVDPEKKYREIMRYANESIQKKGYVFDIFKPQAGSASIHIKNIRDGRYLFQNGEDLRPICDDIGFDADKIITDILPLIRKVEQYEQLFINQFSGKIREKKYVSKRNTDSTSPEYGSANCEKGYEPEKRTDIRKCGVGKKVLSASNGNTDIGRSDAHGNRSLSRVPRSRQNIELVGKFWEANPHLAR